MKATTTIELDGLGKSINPVGTEIVGPGAMVYCRMGIGEPADDECRAACEAEGLTAERRAELLERYQKVASGRATGDPRYDAPDPSETETEGEWKDDGNGARKRKRSNRQPESLGD